MKKINLKNVENFLDRDEMRQVSGGSGGGSGSAYCRCLGGGSQGYIYSCFWCRMACNGSGYICVG